MNILITGASRGIGREFAQQYLNQSKENRVFAVTMNPDQLKTIETEYAGRLQVLSLQMSEESNREKLKEALKDITLDLLINNAGVYTHDPDQLESIPGRNLLEAFKVNTLTPVFTTQACYSALSKSKNPKVISITSLMGSIQDNESGGSYSYRMSKAALNMFNKSVSIDCPKMIAVVLHPGWVKTKMGGPSAQVEVKDSVKGMIHIIQNLKPTDTGKFFDFEGDPLPW